MSNQLDLTFDTPEPIGLYVENGRGSVDVTATDTTETTVRITGQRGSDTVDPRTSVEASGQSFKPVANGSATQPDAVLLTCSTSSAIRAHPRAASAAAIVDFPAP